MSLNAARNLIENNLELPTLPQVVARINALVDDPEVGVREIGAAVAEDAPIAAKVLKIANSAYFGLREKVVSTEHATAVLGVRMLRTVAMQASVVKHYDHLRDNGEFSLESLWRHAILTGQMCAAMASRCRARIGLAPEEFHVVGLLHDIGKILLLESRPEEYLECVRASRSDGEYEHVVEERQFGFHHGHIGALIAHQWGLPQLVSDAIHYHHGPREQLLRDPTVALVALVNLMAHHIGDGRTEQAIAVIDGPACALLGTTQDSAVDLVRRAELWLPQIRI